MKRKVLVLFLALGLPLSAHARVRHVQVKVDQIVTVHTAIGIATIIQVSERPNSVIVGDAESFKIEYLDQAITIKPLRPQARSNLYVYTDYRRFNVELVTGPDLNADYVVYLENANSPRKMNDVTIRWLSLALQTKSGDLVFKIDRAAKVSGKLLVEFSIMSPKSEHFDPAWIWLTQGKTTRPIQLLQLSKSETEPGHPIHGLMEVAAADIDPIRPIHLELRRDKTATLVLPQVTRWK